MPAVFQSPLATFARFVAKDPGSTRVGGDFAYGDHPRQKLSLFTPRRSSGGPLPITIFFYGGSWNSGFKDGYEFVGRALAAQGFLAAVPDYRVVPEARFPTFLEDCAAATRWVLDHAGDHGGGGNVVVMGHSAGAYNAAMLALDPRWLGAERSRVVGLVGIAGPYVFGVSNPITREAFGPRGPAGDAQPVNLTQRDAPPSLLLHGGRDTVVLPASSEELARRLRSAGASATAKIYPALDHIASIGVFALPFRGRSSLFSDAVAFCREQTR